MNTLKRRRLGTELFWRETSWRMDYEKRNFGDLLLREQAGRLFSQKKLRQANIISGQFGGSCLSQEWFNDAAWKLNEKKMLFYGCGVRDLRSPLIIPPCVEMRGVRGPISQNFFPDQKSIGDPAINAPVIMDIFPRGVKSRNLELIFVPHINDLGNHPELRVYKIDAGLGNVESSRTLMKKIASSDFVLAGSLHAGIVAFALGTPFAFFSDGFLDAPLKYHDFCAQYELDVFFAKNFESGIDFWVRSDQITKATKDLNHVQNLLPVRDLILNTQFIKIVALSRFFNYQRRKALKIKTERLKKSLIEKSSRFDH